MVEALEREPGTPPARRGDHRLERALVLALAEVGPPEAGAERQPEHGHRDEPRRQRVVARADPHGHDRLAERHDHDQAVPLDEMARGDLEARIGRPEGGQQDHAYRDRPEQPAARPADDPARDDRERGHDVERRHLEDRAGCG